MLTQSVIAELNKDQPSDFHSRILQHVLGLVDMSRKHMKNLYPAWDEAQNAYKAYQNLDKEDKKAILEGKPTKQRIPAVYAKVQTFKAFILSLYFQRPRFYELDRVGAEDENYKELAEILIDRDLKLNKWFNVINRWAGNLAKLGLGILKHSWEEEYAYVNITTETPPVSFFGMAIGKSTKTTTLTKIPKRVGNKITTTSPYNFLPDVRHPLTDFQAGEFCADETDMPLYKLRQLEAEGVCAGISKIEPLSQVRAQWRTNNLATRNSKINYQDPQLTKNLVRITEVQIKLIPSKFELSDGTKLGTEPYPIKYILWIANDSRIIRIESSNYLHDEFTWDVALFDEDDDTFLSLSLTDLIKPLQDTADWFFNSRVENVAHNLQDKLIVDPVGVDMDSIKNRSRVILLKKGSSRAGVDTYVKQLETRDVTSRHTEDIAVIDGITENVTGLSRNLSGNYHTGRRSAAESRVVTQSAAARPKLTAQSAWGMCLAPFGQKLLCNLRQGLSPELIVKYAGSQYGTPEKAEAVKQFSSTPSDLICACDLWVYDGTLETEKNYLAQQLLELLQQVINLGPTGLLTLELSPKLLVEKIYELLGVGDLSTYSLAKDPQTLQVVVQQLAQQMAQQIIAQTQQQQQPSTPSNADATVA